MAEDYFMKYGQGGATSTDTGMFDALGNYLGNQSLGDNMTAFGVGLGSIDDMFLTGSKVKKEKLKGLKQDNELTGLNIEATKQAMADRKQFNKEAATGMNAAMRNKGLGTIGLSNGVKVV